MENKNKVPIQFLENLGIMTVEEYLTISSKKVLIVGLGGLGGHIANGLVRLGVRDLKIVDFDLFETSNLNRQLFSTHDRLGMYKVDIVKNELMKVNQDCLIKTYTLKIEDIDISNFNDIDYIVDAVDNPQTKIYISDLARRLNIPLLHGACAGWYGQTGWIEPGNLLIDNLYSSGDDGIKSKEKSPTFSPSIVASIMIAEFVKYVQKSEKATINELLLIDMMNNTMIKTGKTKS